MKRVDVVRETPLSVWLRTEAERRGWSFREVARRTMGAPTRPDGITATTVSDVAAGSKTTPDVCRALAYAFGVNDETVMLLAGIIVDRGDVLPEVLPWSSRLRAFRPEDRQRIAQTVDTILDFAEAARQSPAVNGLYPANEPAALAAVG